MAGCGHPDGLNGTPDSRTAERKGRGAVAPGGRGAAGLPLCPHQDAVSRPFTSAFAIFSSVLVLPGVGATEGALWPQGSQTARVPVSCHKEEQAGHGAGGRWGSRQECHLHDHPSTDGDTGTDTGTAPMDVPPRRGLGQLLRLPLSGREPALTCSGLGAPGSLSSWARPLPWPRLPQVSLRKTNAA